MEFDRAATAGVCTDSFDDGYTFERIAIGVGDG